MQTRSAASDDIQKKYTNLKTMFGDIRLLHKTNSKDPQLGKKLIELANAIKLFSSCTMRNSQFDYDDLVRDTSILSNIFSYGSIPADGMHRLDETEANLDAWVAKDIDKHEEEHAKKMLVDYSEMFVDFNKQLTKISESLQQLSNANSDKRKPETSNVEALIDERFDDILILYRQAKSAIKDWKPNSKINEYTKSTLDFFIEMLGKFLNSTLKVDNNKVLQPLKEKFLLYLKMESGCSQELLSQLYIVLEDTKNEVEMLVAECKDAAHVKFMGKDMKATIPEKIFNTKPPTKDTKSPSLFNRK